MKYLSVLFIWLNGTLACFAGSLPDGLCFLHLDAEGAWVVSLTGKSGGTIRTAIEPRDVAVDHALTQLAYIGADGTLRLHDIQTGAERVVLSGDPTVAYAQPAFGSSQAHVYLVAMKDAKSAETDILRVALADGRRTRVAIQPGAQFEPDVNGDRWLTYSSVSCSEGCSKLLQEIWMKDLVGQDTWQVTRFNGVAREPVTDGRSIVFSANRGAFYQLWRSSIDGTDVQQLTYGDSNAVSPAMMPDGRIYYIRQTPGGARLVRLDPDRSTHDVTPDGVRNIRSLRSIP